MGVDPVVFVREFLTDYLQAQLQNGEIYTGDYFDLEASLRGEEFEHTCRELFAHAPRPVALPGFGRCRIVELKEATGARFPFLQGLHPRKPRTSRSCFVGFRFLPRIEDALRLNLRTLLEPYGIRPVFANDDIAAKAMFEKVVTQIEGCDFCIFDTLGTRDRPNVFIEIGIALAARTSFIVCQYDGDGILDGMKLPDTGKFPSDLEFLTRIQYDSYQALCRELYFKLPQFLR